MLMLVRVRVDVLVAFCGGVCFVSVVGGGAGGGGCVGANRVLVPHLQENNPCTQ